MTGLDDGVIRTRRIEVLDGKGRPRVVLGDLSGGAPPEQVFGLALLDQDGRQRAWLAIHDHGATLAFDRVGNTVLELGVDDGEEAMTPGVYVQFSDDDGRPALGWRVDGDGEVVAQDAAHSD